MRKIMLCLCLLCIGTIARGQTVYEYVYWFDDDYAARQTAVSNSSAWQFEADASALDESFHTLHVQVRDTVWSSPVTRMFVNLRNVSVRDGRYWFDDENENQHAVYGVNGLFDVDVSQLSDGLHTIHYVAMDAKGFVTPTVSRQFIKIPKADGTMAAHYWFDNDNSTMVTATTELIWLDVSALDDGLHTLHVMAESTSATQTLSYQFLKIPQTDGVDYLNCLCYLDGRLYHQEKVPSSGGIVNWQFDVSSMAQGIHNIQVQVVTPSGAATSLYESMFLRSTTHAELASMKCFYTIDNADTYIEAGTYANGAFHFDLDVSALDDGLHQLAYMLVGDNGVSTKVSSAFFMKTPLGGNGITQYWYWLNDDDANKTVVKLDERTNPFQLIGLLPVESVPIRSSLFHFEVDEEQGPMVYAKNEFHIRFFDATGRLVDATKEYLDYNVSEKVTGLEEIKRTQTFARPAENSIKWFTLQAFEGDTIAFRSSQALSLQVFSPSGKEIYAASGAESVKWGGCHTWEDGTHYVAVHDVTGSQPNVTLDYLHMDKYDVVDQDVRVVGNGGCSTITFYGNGFNDLYAVDLVCASGDTIDAKAIHHESDATVNVAFDFTDKTIGKYNAVFHFTTEDKKFADFLTVEEAKDITLDIDVQYPSTFLRGTYTTYTISVYNVSNMTAYNVPIELRLRVNDVNEISDVKFAGDVRSMSNLYEELDLDSLEEETIELLKELSSTVSDISQFIIYRDTVENMDYGVSHVIVNIPPASSKTITISVKSNSNVNLEAYISEDWLPLIVNTAARSRAYARGIFNREWMCCYKKRIQCGADIVANLSSMLPPGLSCATSLLKTGLSASFDFWCSEGENFSEQWDNYIKNEGATLAQDLIGSLVDCVTSYYKLLKKSLRKDYNLANSIGNKTEADRIYSEILAARKMEESLLRNIYNGITTFILGDRCHEAFTDKKPNCPPKPKGGGGSSTPVNSYDPNEIYGYLSPSGSKYIAKDSVETVNYRIEFENDTAFATSSAHVVEIRDTLDTHFFELGTFAPTYLNIGDKREQLDGTPNFVRTVDMRPQINTVVQVEGQYDEQTGIARWLFTSLDPMTMEPTDDVMQGFLPVNYDGTSGVGDVAYRIGLKKGLDDGTVITNRASIVFDNNEPILTPTWINIVDGSAPTSEFISVEELNDTVIRLKWKGNDGESPAWRYSLAVQAVEDTEWFEFLSNTTDTVFDYRYYRDIDYGFCVLATDSAGNVESREWVRKAEFMREYIAGDADRSGTVNLLDLNLTLSHILGGEVNGCDMLQMDANGDGSINVLDINAILQIILDADGEGAAQRKRDNGVIRIINTKVI